MLEPESKLDSGSPAATGGAVRVVGRSDMVTGRVVEVTVTGFVCLVAMAADSGSGEPD